MTTPTKVDPVTNARVVGRRWLYAAFGVFVVSMVAFIFMPADLVATWTRLVSPASVAWFCLGAYFNRRGYIDGWRDRDRTPKGDDE